MDILKLKCTLINLSWWNQKKHTIPYMASLGETYGHQFQDETSLLQLPSHQSVQLSRVETSLDHYYVRDRSQDRGGGSVGDNFCPKVGGTVKSISSRQCTLTHFGIQS